MAPFIFRIINLKRCYSYSANSPRHPSISARGGEPPLHRHSTFVTRSMGPLGGPMGQPWCPPCQGSGVPRSSGGQNAQRQFARCTQPWSPLPVPTPSHLGGPRSPALSPGASRCGSISNLRNQLVPVCRGLVVFSSGFTLSFYASRPWAPWEGPGGPISPWVWALGGPRAPLGPGGPCVAQGYT